MPEAVVIVERDWKRAEHLSLSLFEVDSGIMVSVRQNMHDCLLNLNRDVPTLIIVGAEDIENICRSVKLIKRHRPATKIMTLRMNDARDTQRLIHHGVDFMEHPNVSNKVLKKVFAHLNSGDPILNDLFVSHLIEGLRQVDNGPTLTKRERDVLIELSHGKTYKEICDALSFTRGSLTVHIQNLYGKLGVSRRSEALAVAFERKYIARAFPIL